MKFGVTIKNSLYADWQSHYIDYSGLKKFIKHRQARKQWDDADEQAFVNELDKELSKVADFQAQKIVDLHDTIAAYESEVKNLIEQQQNRRQGSSNDLVGEARLPAEEEERGGGGDSDDESDTELHEHYERLEEDLTTIIADVHDLGHFSHLNYTGFIKIVKKHDKKTGWELRRDFIQQHLEKRPFYKENYEALVVELSRLFNLVRTRGNPIVGDSSAGGGQSAFVRQTTKYWVHRDNFVALKLLVLKHLPVLVFNPDKPFEASDSAISSIYFDNEDLDLYLGRLEKTEGAEAIRMRWYGGMEVNSIFVERKTHREDWTGEKSVKARFMIKEDQLNDYLTDKLSMEETFEAMKKKGKKSEKEVDAMIKLSKEVQQRIKDKKLGPCMRTFYNRTAFQQPGDARVRISFDTDLTMVREDNWDGQVRSGSNWRRMDVGIDFPFEQLKKEDKDIFPYGVLEVKLQTQMGQEPPEWVKELVSGPLVEAVPKFSKFIHGCATLLPERVSLVPFWLPQMETDIKKIAADRIINRPQPNSGSATSPSDSPLTKPSSATVYGEPLSEDEDGMEDEDVDPMNKLLVVENESSWVGLPPSAIAEVKAFREIQQRNGNEDDGSSQSLLKPPSGKIQQEQQFPKLTPGNLQKLLKVKLMKGEDQKRDEVDESDEGGNNEDDGEEREDHVGPRFVQNFKAPKGKLVAVPVRIEPKVYFATERTFLTWLEFSVLLGAIAVSLLNFTAVDDEVGFVAALCFTIVALLAIAYSTGMYVYRVTCIRKRSATGYYDRVGPTALCVVLFGAMVINFVMRITHHP